MKRHWVFLVGLIMVGLFAVPAMNAQTTATISGTVSDPSGALVPKAEVTITNQATGAKRLVVANESGFFTAPQLPVGTYTVAATAAGFKTAEKKNIELHVADELTVAMVLEIGTMSEVVTVTGGAIQVELRSGEVSNLIGSQQMTELPLNGRSFVQLVTLVPGASIQDGVRMGATGLFSSADMSVSGSASNANAWLVDGVDNVDHGSGRTLLIYPSVDSVEEFKVQRNSYGADNPSAGGVQVNLVTKGGSNSFHGTVYEFFRNDKLDANNFFLNQAGQPRAEVRSNNFGYTFGGPIKKDKVFFFWSQEWRRQVRGVARHTVVPTAAERIGDFSTPSVLANMPTPVNPLVAYRNGTTTLCTLQDSPSDCYNPPFPGNKIPQNQLSPFGLALMKLYPLPNLATPTQSGQNWVSAVPSGNPTREEQIRGDINISSKTSLMMRYTQDAWINPAPNGGAENGLWGDNGYPTVDSTWDQPSKSAAARLTHTFGPTAINTFQFAYSNNRILITPGMGQDILKELNTTYASVFPRSGTVPYPTFWGGPMPGSGNLWNIAPWNNAMDLWSFKDDYTKSMGNHAFKVGVMYNTSSKDEDGGQTFTGQFWGPVAGGLFNGVATDPGGGPNVSWGNPNAPGMVNGNWGGQITGNRLADGLLKGVYWAGGDEQQNMIRFRARWHDFETYFADTWRVAPRLTIDYGLRYSYLPPSFDGADTIANFIPALFNANAADPKLSGLIFPEGLSMPDFGIKGGASNLKGIDVGRGLRNTSWHNGFAPRLGIAWDPTGSGKWAIRMGAGYFYGRSDVAAISAISGNPPFSATVSFWDGRPFDTRRADIPTPAYGVPTTAMDTNWSLQGSYQWNFTVEHEVMKDTKIEVAYVATRGHHLPYNYNLNYVKPEDRTAWIKMAYDPNGGSTENANMKYRNLVALTSLQGTSNAGARLTYITQGANSNYQSGQIFLNKRFSNNYSYQLAYTFSKLLSSTGLGCCSGDDTVVGLVDIFNPSYNKGIGAFDRTHILSFNMIYKFPLLNGKSKFLQGIGGGWEGTAIYQYSSGIPLQVNTGDAILPVGTDNQHMRADLVGSPTANLAPGQFVNPAAFSPVINFLSFGNSPRGAARAPAVNNMDLALYKNFKIKEGKQLQFRMETFNTFNHPQFYNIDLGYQTQNLQRDINKMQYVACDALPGHSFPDCNRNTHFGYPNQVRDPREIQFALKFIF